MPSHAITSEEAYARFMRQDVPDELAVSGVLDFSEKSERLPPATLPASLKVDVLDLSGRSVFALPDHLECYELNLSRTPIPSLTSEIRVTSRLDMSGCEHLESLPADLTVGTLVLRGCTSLRRLPENLDVWFLDVSGCWAFEHWPEIARIRGGRLQLQGCTALKQLPPYLDRLAALNVRDCPNLKSLPDEIQISGWLDLGHSGLIEEAQLPKGLDATQLRWAGINIDRRIAFHSESIQLNEVLDERNAERRRVLLDRYGYGRFLKDSHAEVVDSDSDPGGPRQLMRVKLEGDEDLVALSCFCPSTGRQYMIRVPPSTPSCRHAAAWIAGFDDPDDYRPVLET